MLSWCMLPQWRCVLLSPDHPSRLIGRLDFSWRRPSWLLRQKCTHHHRFYVGRRVKRVVIPPTVPWEGAGSNSLNRSRWGIPSVVIEQVQRLASNQPAASESSYVFRTPEQRAARLVAATYSQTRLRPEKYSGRDTHVHIHAHTHTRREREREREREKDRDNVWVCMCGCLCLCDCHLRGKPLRTWRLVDAITLFKPSW